ncbi:zinc dependent phospholipase C family protein [Paenibacillus radicis (ex Xue et al. 2023)]|uniref:Zinc dependent phospholipase C family protein n=1 Tax=Paenibacillus radicis (ex Xue et al. 2023) TaxID=2972489 RepID=A0ABT1YHR7_9BACL|nr:zinc dependent phospholipase C family protein [Paenibacillus radicis (ex Xue et al. 2023)]MCR8632739.1 zinc dependent phospholipase C family protein [Paenibacillus radicis (ex Xue et al. 2023)]
MGSRIMHYCISSLLSDKLGIDNRNEFMLGGIAPDIHGFMGVAKGVTHFKDIDASGKSRINYLRFYVTYKDVMNKPFYLGYLCHLISDVVWLELYLRIVEFASPEQLKEKAQVAYRDFERLNGRIIKQYSLKLHQHVLPTVNIDGFNSDYLPALLDGMRKDFSIDEVLMNETLELFNNNNCEIIDYINRSVDESMAFLSSMK